MARAHAFAVLLLVVLCGWPAPGAYRITYQDSAGTYTAYALSTPRGLGTRLISLHHDRPSVGHLGWVYTLRGRIPFAVVEAYGEWVVIATHAVLIPGDSGSGIIGDCGAILGVVHSRPWQTKLRE